MQSDDICASSSETSFIEKIEEMLLMSVKKDGDWFGSWNDSLRKYNDQSLLFSRQERLIVNVLQLRRSRKLQGLNIERSENDAEAVIRHPPAAAQLNSNLKVFTKTRDLFLKSFRLFPRRILTNLMNVWMEHGLAAF